MRQLNLQGMVSCYEMVCLMSINRILSTLGKTVTQLKGVKCVG